jgi:response regulator RpfG family c-di-GMP phosphodiesterase
MSEISYLLAVAHGISEEEAELIRRAAPMHDIGKIATPDAILLKPGKLCRLGHETQPGREEAILF